MLGLLVGIGVSIFFVYVAFLLLAKVLEINSDKIIFIIAAAPIIFFMAPWKSKLDTIR